MDEFKKNSNQLTIILSILFTAFIAIKLSGVLIPFMIAFFLAYLFNPLVNKISFFYKNRLLPRTLGVVVVFLLLFFLLGALIFWVIPILINQLALFVTSASNWLVVLEKEWLPWLAQHFNVQIADFTLEKSKSLLAQHGKQISATMGAFSSILLQSGMNIIHGFIQISIILVVLFYLLRDWPTLLNKLERMALSYSYGQTVCRMAGKCHEVLSVFLRGQLLVMAALGAIYALGLSLVGVNYAILLGFISGVLSIVPYLGGVVGLAVSLLVAYFQFHDWHTLLLVFGVFGIGQLLESMVLTPYLIGDKLGLHPVIVIFSIMAGGELFGFFGVLLALPVAAMLVVLVKDYHQTRRDNDVGPTAF